MLTWRTVDDKWFKKRQKEVGVTAEDIAREMGRTRSNVSHIYSGDQRMSLDWARAFAKVLQVPLEEVLKRAGVSEPAEAQRLTPGFSESDAAPFVSDGSAADNARKIAALLGGDKPGVDIWTVRTDALMLEGYRRGDLILVDTHQSERCRAGDMVIAQLYNWKSGSVETVLRLFEPPVLIAVSATVSGGRTHVVDGNNVVIRGKVIASWRTN